MLTSSISQTNFINNNCDPPKPLRTVSATNIQTQKKVTIRNTSALSGPIYYVDGDREKDGIFFKLR